MKLGDTGYYPMTITQEGNQMFADLSGDYNPVHFSEERTAKTRFGKPIANGIQVITGIGTAIVKMFCDETHMVIAIEQHNTFIKPVYIGETVNTEITVEEVLSKTDCWISALVKNREQQVVISSRFRIRVLDA